MSSTPKYFERDVAFSASENPFGFDTIRLFGEKLLHVEMNTDYGKKEIVCGFEPILNHVLLKNGEIERYSVFASYNVAENGNVDVRVSNENGENVWTFDFENGSLAFELFGTNCKIMISPLLSAE